MLRAVTTLELLITLAISIIAIYFISPVWFQLQDRIMIENEVENVKSFLYQIQDNSRYKNQNYALTIAKNNQNWCIIAVAKNQEKVAACDCLNLKSCDLNKTEYQLYRNIHQVDIYNRNLYPKILTHFDGKSGNQSTICLNIFKDKNQAILQIQRNGVINVLIDQRARSQCKETS